MKSILLFLFIVISSVNSFSQQEFELFSFLGKKIGSIEVQDYVTVWGDYEVEDGMPRYPHLMFFDAGVELVLEKETNTVSSIFLMGTDCLWYQQYSSILPFGLNWHSSRADVEKILGRGERRSFGDEIVIQYPEKNIEFEYLSEDESNMDAQIKNILIRTF